VYSEGREPAAVVSAMQFRKGPGKGTTTGIGSVAALPTQSGPIDTVYTSTEEFETGVPEKEKPGGDEEAQIRKMPSLTAPFYEDH